MKKALMLKFILIMVIPLFGASQNIEIIMNTPTTGWGLNEINLIQVQNNSNQNITCGFMFEVSLGSGELVYKTTGAGIQVKSGLNFISTGRKVNFDSYFGNNQAAKYLSSTGFLPSGKYVFSAELSDMTGRVISSKGFENSIVMIQSPIQLTTPMDNDTINTLYPIFNWIPPFPIDAQNTNYRFQLFEVKNNSSNSKSFLKSKIPIGEFTKKSQTNFLYSISSNLPRLEWEHTYEWKVSALAENTLISESAIWEFTPKQTHQNPKMRQSQQDSSSEISSNVYWILDNELDGGYYNLSDGNCYLSLNNYSKDTLLTYQVFDPSNGMTEVVGLPTVPIQFGKNFCKIPFISSGVLTENNEYLLKIKLSDGEKYSVRFLYKEEQ